MKKSVQIFIVLSLLLLSFDLFGQNISTADYWENSQQIKKTGMLVLGSWAIGNIAVGIYGNHQYQAESKYFHQMNLYWNLVNLGIAAFGFYSAYQANMPQEQFLLAKEHFDFQKVLLFNAGLDIAYMAGGMWMMSHAKTVNRHAARWRGFGQSVILQGAFLFSFDLIMYYLHQSTNPKLQSVLSQISLKGNAISFIF